MKKEYKVYKNTPTFYDVTNPVAAPSCGKVVESRHLVSEKLGRLITSDEIVHHVNNDPQDNDINNLQVMTKREHSQYHHKLRGHNTVPYDELPELCQQYTKTEIARMYNINYLTIHAAVKKLGINYVVDNRSGGKLKNISKSTMTKLISQYKSISKVADILNVIPYSIYRYLRRNKLEQFIPKNRKKILEKQEEVLQQSSNDLLNALESLL